MLLTSSSKHFVQISRGLVTGVGGGGDLKNESKAQCSMVKPTKFNLYDLFILINNNMYLFVATRNKTNVCV
jgi:hypothetical protein